MMIHVPSVPYLAARDKTFLEQVGTHFASPPPLSEEALVYVGVIAVCIAIVIVGAVVLNILRGNRRKKARAGWITEPAAIAALLRQAVDGRAKFEVAFRIGENLFVPCTPLDVGNKGVTLDLGPGRTLDAHWKGRTVRVYFRTDEGEGPAFLAFESPILDVAARGGSPLCVLATPTALERTQKRLHLRVSPPEEMLLGLALWQAKASLPEAMAMDGLGPAQLSLHPGRTRPVIRVENISAGGLRLAVELAAARLAELRCTVGSRLFARLDLYLPEAGGKLRLWLHLRVQNGFDDAAMAEIGCMILHQGVVREDEHEAMIHWRPVSDDGVAVLGNWAIQRDLEQHRMAQGEAN